MTRETPSQIVTAYERGATVPEGPGDRYAGYGVLGVAFASGDILALRRFPVASTGCGYTAVWHRRPDGAWVFHTDASCDQGCTSHFAPALERVQLGPIRLEWEDGWRLTVYVDGGREIVWSLRLGSTWRTRAATALAAVVPERYWVDPLTLDGIALLTRGLVGTGPIRLTGHLPSGARFYSNPRRVWEVETSRASIRGTDLGAMTLLPGRASLGEFLIPRRPLLASGPLFIEPA